MKKVVLEFVRRGATACGLGPLVLAVLYLILGQRGVVEHLTVEQICVGICSVSALAFVAGGMNSIYQIERLPLMAAVFIHGAVLYVTYLLTYLINDWLEWGMTPILAFSGIFILGYLMIWAIIYAIIRKNTKKLNEILQQKQRFPEAP